MNWEENKEKAIRVYALGKNDYVNESLVTNTVKGKGFSLPAAILGCLYFAYRKLYLWAFAIFAVDTIISAVTSAFHLPDTVDYGIATITFVIEGIIFYPLYQKQIRKDYEMCEESHDWEQKLQSRGGTNGWIPLAYIVALIALFIAIYALVNMGILK